VLGFILVFPGGFLLYEQKMWVILERKLDWNCLRVEADTGTELKPGILNKRHFLELKTITTH
jgi:hypothetical protein